MSDLKGGRLFEAGSYTESEAQKIFVYRQLFYKIFPQEEAVRRHAR